MQIIQTIRDKGAAIVIVVISLSLIGFILMDSRSGSDRGAGSLASSVGKAGGEDIELGTFNKRITQAENMQAQRTGQRPGGAESNQLREQVWNQIIAENIFYKEAKKLGINFTSKELSAILLSNNPNNPFMQQQGMMDPATGQLDIAKAQQALVNIKKMKPEDREAVEAQIIDPLKLTALATKYSGLLSASAYYPAWMKNRDVAETNNFATISYVAVPYTDISDSTVKVTDEDVTNYVQKHKDLFKQEAGRKISYLTFSQLPTAVDSTGAKANIEKIKTAFATDTNAKAFVARNGSFIDYNDAFLPKEKINSDNIDTILSAPQGTVYGPYVEQGGYVLAKVIGSSQLPDSVNARHILIALNDNQTGQPLRTDAAAKTLADSILTAVKAGADFGALAVKYSADGSKDKGGDLGTFGYGMMVPEFNEFSFTKPAGSTEVVQTQYGYHVINIVKQTNFKPAYKIAFIGKEIAPSELTITNASMQATKASSQKTATALSKYAAANGLGLTQIPTPIKENDFSVGALQDARQLVKWAFEANKGDVSEPFNIGNQFVVVTVDKIEKEGVQDVFTARNGAEAIIRNQKKAKIIKDKLTDKVTLESAAAAYSKQVQQAGADSSLTFSAQMVNGVGVEPKLVGAAFNKAFSSKVSPAIEGTNAVYVVKVNGVQTKSLDTPEAINQKAAIKLGVIRSQTNNWFESLRKQADIKDNRSKFF